MIWNQPLKRNALPYAALLSAAMGLTACAGDAPPPTAQLGASSQAVLTAERAGAPQFAPAELQAARDKLAAADTAMRADQRTRARRLAEEAQADAELATVRAQRAVSQQAAGVVRQQAMPQQALPQQAITVPPATAYPTAPAAAAPAPVAPVPVAPVPVPPNYGASAAPYGQVPATPAVPPQTNFNPGATSWGTTYTYEGVRQ